MTKNNQTSHFSSRPSYVEWRAHWRRRYKELSEQIHRAKAKVKMGYSPKKMQCVLAMMRHEAHTMMIARESVEQTYRRNKLAA